MAFFCNFARSKKHIILNFIVIIRYYSETGNILIPYMVRKNKDCDLSEFVMRVSPDNIKGDEALYPEYQQRIGALAYRCENLLKQQHGTNTDCTDRMVGQIIDLCVQNGVKIYYISPNIRAVLPEDEVTIMSEDAHAVFNFDRDEDGTRYYLTINCCGKDIPLRKKDVIVLSDSPCNILIDKKLMRFSDINANKITPFVDKDCISVPKRAELEYYKKFVKNTITTNAIVNAVGFRIVNIKPKRKAIVSVEDDITGGAVISLKFRYGEYLFEPSSPNIVIVNFYENDGDYYFEKFARDLRYEADVEAAATEIFGGRELPGTYRIKHQSSLVKFQYDCAINAIKSNRERLAAAGIEADIKGIKAHYYTGGIHLDFNVKSDSDWFDIYAIVRLDNYDIPFIALRQHILNDNHEFRLPDGRIVILPYEWFERYKGVMLAASVGRNEDHFLLHKYQYSALLTLQLDSDLTKRIEALRDKLANFDKIPQLQPTQVKATLRPYQIVAFNWLRMMRDCNFGACLADDMGLGKTLCTLSLLSDSPAMEAGDFTEGLFAFDKKIPSLLIVPKSLIYNWVNEAKKFVPHLKILEFTGNNRLDYIKSFPLYDIVISGYATLRNDIDLLSQCTFNYIVLDESQTVKNPSSMAYQSIMQLKCRHRLALTGTPLENSLSDLWSQINFINPGLLGSLSSFRQFYVGPIVKKLDGSTSEKLKKLITPFMLRRTKQQVLQDLPDLVEQTILCEMTEQQQKIYEAEKSRTRNSILEFMEQDIFEKSTVMVLQSLTKLRQIACTPYLIDNDYDGGSGKTDEVIRALTNVIGQGHKVLVFSSFVQHLNHIARQLDALGVGYAMLTGSTEHRDESVHKFEDGNVPVFLISIKAGGTGLNLTSADYVFIIDPWWNPAVEEQAIARAHRMGQKNSVMAYRFISKGTVEEKIQIFQHKKTDLAATFVGDSMLPVNFKDDVLSMLE